MKLGFRTGVILLGAVAAMTAEAQGTGSYTVKLPPGVKAGDVVTKSAAGATFGSPMGFGASWGEAGVGLYSQTFESVDDEVDGALGFAMGFGDARKAVGLEVGLALSSLWGGTNSGGGFGENGAFSAKLHTRLPGAAALAIGITGLGRFGDDNDSRQTSVYLVGTKVYRVSKYAVVANLGLGNRFFNQSTNNEARDSLGPLGSLAFYVNPQVSLIADYNGNVLNAGVSVAPLKQYPLTVTLGAINTTERGDGRVEFGGMASYGFRF
jgi:hypothetical protein